MKRFKKILALISYCLLIVLFTGCNSSQAISTNQTNTTNGNLKVNFVDVGQADSVLIQEPSGKSMLIDAGNNDDSDLVVNYIKSQGIKKLDYVIGTHPHEDHIGGMDAVIREFEVGKVILPKASSNTKTFEDVLLAIKNKGLKVTQATPGNSFNLGNAKCEVLAPNGSKYEDLNNFSVVIKLTHGKNSFLFTGDAENVSEQEMLNKGYNLKADLLKVGHHGSNSSTTPTFLKAVSPKFAVISVGKGNDYGHPTQSTLDKLNNLGIQVFRTDELGTIVATSDGTNITINKNASTVKTNASPIKTTVKSQVGDINNNVSLVYITKLGKKYHIQGCNSLSKEKIAISISDAKSKGYEPCKKCNP